VCVICCSARTVFAAPWTAAVTVTELSTRFRVYALRVRSHSRYVCRFQKSSYPIPAPGDMLHPL
jgi:hypothetical protein